MKRAVATLCLASLCGIGSVAWSADKQLTEVQLTETMSWSLKQFGKVPYDDVYKEIVNRLGEPSKTSANPQTSYWAGARFA
jgi:hypothetical protein